MFNITWDKQTGGVKLSTQVEKETLGISPRPVFYEELDLLKLDELGWTYPRCEQPLLWAVNKKYYYRAEYVFEAKGANLYDAPTVNFAAGKEKLKLKPVDVAGMLRKNQDFMFLLESEAIEFIRDVFVQYSSASKSVERVKANQIDFEALKERVEKRTKTKMAIVREDCDSFDIMPLEQAEKQGKREYKTTKIDKFIASFSGGKDSQVILDLCTRAIAPTDFEVIYSDTGYELPPSLELYDKVEKYYKEKFPKLKFTLARNHESVLNYWDKIGTPSDTHRWCCTVMKTAPLYRTLKVEGTNRQAKVIAFEGVRAEESVKRSSYHRIGSGVKHSFVINARPILRWSTTEIFLYLFSHKLPINTAYRIGKPRVGCILCPFGSPWDDMIVKRFYPNAINPFIERIERIITDRKIPNGKQYLSERLWKMRSSGLYSKSKSSISITSTCTSWEAKVVNSQLSLLTWLPTLGEYSININAKGLIGQIYFNGVVYPFELTYLNEKKDFKFILKDNNNIKLRYLLRRLLHKTTYCINCESCEIECPTGALSVLPSISIDTAKCIHCYKCLDFHDTGCIVADSLISPTNKIINVKKMKISSYGTFGIQQDWLDQYLADTENFWEDCSLGVNQIHSFKAWLKDAEIVDDKCVLTSFGELCIKISQDNPNLLWEIIYVNLAKNNSLLNWFVQEFQFGSIVSRKDIDILAIERFQSIFAVKTITYAVQALLQVFKYSPIGKEFETFIATDTKNTQYTRNPYSDITLEGVAYSLYKYGQTKGISSFRVSDLYRQEENCGIYREFGISQEDLKKKLRALSTDNNRVIIAELNMGLDHITLRDDLTPLTTLQLLLED